MSPSASGSRPANIFANPDFASRRQQHNLRRMVCASLRPNNACGRTLDELADAAIGLFKTPGLRTLAQSALARAGRLRNGARELKAMHIGEDDVAPLAAFLRSLNEDYE
jgi:hypothetical protein